MAYSRGDAVIYNGNTYYIVEGPIMGTQGAIYHISAVPPPVVVNERDLKPAFLRAKDIKEV